MNDCVKFYFTILCIYLRTMLYIYGVDRQISNYILCCIFMQSIGKFVRPHIDNKDCIFCILYVCFFSPPSPKITTASEPPVKWFSLPGREVQELTRRAAEVTLKKPKPEIRVSVLVSWFKQNFVHSS